MKRYVLLGLIGVCLSTHIFAQEGEKTMQTISKVESRASIDVKQSEYKNYFTGDVRVDMLYPQSNTKTHSGAHVTFEPRARTNWHVHPAGQHIIVTSGVGYYQTWGEPMQIIKAGDVVWIPVGVKHWHGASKEIAMTHLVVTGADEHGKNVEWLEPVSDEQYFSKN
ncbi:(R)-mandelonitrile lyase [Sulfurospirillum deleyianum]|uniref:Cupin 2 conserved barrel domain protein n=1 Tax=Sulfurospirillum deleyianum (strain ATCC 51133 / DSM 6946 / 5175) TaxID=525898 RepID=D1B264_SULD5|nr:cupin domain-containing protein [Sulfurospirillum deleyianum]ACZ12184.1 Cupin 2 conserved barrel domain protein [Sulfurospirillum deleyianum DSM 6946]